MQKLSVAIITYNEEARIASCLESIRSIADEIIVVDSGSTDKTLQIAEQQGATTITHAFEGYAAQKNFAFTQCNNPFILSLDADEKLDPEAIGSIKSQKEKDFPFDGYFLKRITYIGTKPVKHGSWYPDKKIRLVKKNIGQWKGKGVHESLEVNSANTFTLNGHIHHFSYKNTKELFDKTRTYADLAARHLHSEGKKISPGMVYIKAFVRFFKHYFLKGGIFAGGPGWQIGKQQYFEAFYKYRTLYELNKKARSEKQKISSQK